MSRICQNFHFFFLPVQLSIQVRVISVHVLDRVVYFTGAMLSTSNPLMCRT
jgi:hypothetical protein